MKKVLIGILLLLPIVIVGAVVLATEIISTLTQIPVDSIQIYYDGQEAEVLVVGVGESGQLTAKVFPTAAYNKDYTFDLDTDELDLGEDMDIEAFVTLDKNSGEITFNAEGDYDVYALSDDGGLRSYISFHVILQAVSEVVVNAPTDSIFPGDTYKIDAYVLPYDALNKNLIFTSADESIASVDKNGIITAHKAGSVKITVQSEESPELSSEFTLNVESGNPIRMFEKESIISAKSSINLSAYYALATMPSLTVTGPATLDGNTLTFSAENELVTVSASGYRSLTLEYDPSANGIYIVQKELLTSTESGTRVFMGGRSLFLDAAFIAEGKTGAFVWDTSDATVATVKDGFVTPVSDGTVTITVSSAGETDSITLSVIQEVAWARLNHNTVKDKTYGLAQYYVYGSYILDGNVYTPNEIDFGFVGVYPEQSLDTLNSKFIWTSSDESLATVNENGKVVITPFEEKTTKQVTITATPKYPMYESYVYTVSYVLNINNGTDVTTYEGLYNVVSASKVANLRNSISCTHYFTGESWIHYLFAVTNDINGNGYTIDATEAFKAYDVGGSREGNNGETTVFRLIGDNVTIDNLTIRGTSFEGDVGDLEQVRKSFALMKFVPAEKTIENKFFNITISHSILENSELGILSDNADFNMTGCVVRNIFKSGIFLRNADYGDMTVFANNTINFHNNVFYDCLLFPISIDSVQNKKQADIPSTINITGLFKIYNWRNPDDIPIVSLFAEIKDSEYGDFIAGLGARVKSEIGKHDELLKYDNGVPYILLGFAEPVVSLLNIDYVYTVNIAEELPYVMREIIIDVGISTLGGRFLTLPQDSDYIEIGDKFNDSDRIALKG